MARIKANDPKYAPSPRRAVHPTTKIRFPTVYKELAPSDEALLLTKPTSLGKKRKTKADDEGAEVIINDNKYKRNNEASKTGLGTTTHLLGEKKKKKKKLMKIDA